MTNTETTPPEIKRKMQFKGKVVKTTLAGAIVDIGQDKPGIVHISHLQKEPVKRVEDVVQAGQEVDVWVRRVKKDANHIELTMIEPLALEWRDIKKGMSVKGEIVRLEKFGAFIEIGAERPGLAHISELTHDYIKAPEDAVKVGQVVEAKVIDFNRRKKQIKLSLKALKEEPTTVVEEEEIEEEPTLTAMQIAYEKAMGNQDKPESNGEASKNDDSKKGKDIQDDILARTLEHKARTK
jgi:ribosomal protein S1